MAWFRCNGNQFKGYIDIYGTANALVTATTTGKAYSATCDGNGYARIKVKKKGAYNVTSTGTNRVAHATVNNKTPVTATYNWQKWDSQYYYYMHNSDYSGHQTVFWSYTALWSVYASATGYSFDDNSGTFYLSGGIATTLRSSSYASIASRNYPYSAYPAFSGSPSEGTTMVQYIDNGSLHSSLEANGYYARISDEYNQGCIARVWNRSGTYRKGGTQYANATGTTLNALPANGRADDGYWYIAS